MLYLFLLWVRVHVTLHLPSAPRIEHEEVELNFCHRGDPDKDL